MPPLCTALLRSPLHRGALGWWHYAEKSFAFFEKTLFSPLPNGKNSVIIMAI